MIFQHLSTHAIYKQIQHYTNLLNNRCNNPEIIDSFIRDCYAELKRRENDLHHSE